MKCPSCLHYGEGEVEMNSSPILNHPGVVYTCPKDRTHWESRPLQGVREYIRWARGATIERLRLLMHR